MCQQYPSSTTPLLISHRNSSQPQLRHIRPGLRVPPQEPHRFTHTPPSAREPSLHVNPAVPHQFTTHRRLSSCASHASRSLGTRRSVPASHPPSIIGTGEQSPCAAFSQHHRHKRAVSVCDILPASTAQEGSLRVRHSPRTINTEAQSPPRLLRHEITAASTSPT